MTEKYLQVHLTDGTTIPFEVDEAYDGPVRAGLAETFDRASQTLETGIDKAKEIAKTVAARIGSLPPPAPSKVSVEIGLKMSATAGVVVAKAATEAHIKITVEWQNVATGLSANP